MDPVDRKYVEDLLPDGAMYTGHISIVTFLAEDGDPSYRVYSMMEQPLSSILGYLDMAKMHMAARCNGAEYLGLRQYDDDDY